MQITKGITVLDLALYIEKDKTLVIADTHIGYEESLNKQGMLIPRFHFKDLIERIEKVLKKVDVGVVVINGDIKHEFGKISDTEWRHTLQLIDLFLKYASKVVLVKGNHDKIIGPIAAKRNVEVVEKYKTGDILIVHGDKIVNVKEELREEKVKIVIIGHEHPAVSLVKDGRVEKYKCFLKGKYKGKGLIVQPSFNLVTEGTNILREDVLSPYLKKNLGEFEVYVVGDSEIFSFGTVKELVRKMKE